ncbi:hypothetical protein HMI55_000313, partial [Coelomomyces lativittatus]
MGAAKKIGRRRIPSRHPPSTSNTNLQSAPSASNPQEISKHLQKVQTFIDQDEIESAYSLLLELHSQVPQHVEILYLLGTLSLDLGHPEAAVHFFSTYLQIDPNHPEVLLHMAQLSPPAQSPQLYLQAIQLLETNVSLRPKNVLVQAYCALAEVYLTDLCFDAQAPELCQHYLSKAITLDATLADPHVMLASMYISKDEPDLAWTSLTTSLSKWWPNWLAWQRHNETPLLPTYELRKHTAQLCMELNRVCISMEVLKSCLYEHEDDVELWYLFGWAMLLRCEQLKQGVPKDSLTFDPPLHLKENQGVEAEKVEEDEEEEEEEDMAEVLTDAMTCLTKAKK